MKRRALVGRERELSQLVAALDTAANGDVPPLVQVLGEPGIGKSRLLTELCELGEARGFLVLDGRAGEFESELPFGVFIDAMDDYLASLGPDRLGNLEPWLPELASIFPSFVEPAGGRTGPIHAERYRTYGAVRALLEELARKSPLVLVLDDLHWSDAASAEVVAHLCSQPPRGGVLVAVGLRSVQVDPCLMTTLVAAARERRSVRLQLSPLTLADARHLLSNDAAGTQDDLYRESGGNPFYLEQLARRTGGGPALPEPAPPDASVPGAVRWALSAELASLSPRARQVLQGASVVGDPFDAEVAGLAADAGWDELSGVLDELAARELIREHDTPRTFRFRHPIVRRAVYESSGPGWRLAAHARVADALDERGAPPRIRAHHLERSARPGDVAAVDVLVEAARTTQDRAPLTAARWFDAAVRLLPDGADRDDRSLDLLVQRAVALGIAGKSVESHAVLEQAAERLVPDHPGRTPVVAFCARLEFCLGRFDQGRSRLLAELERVGAEPSPEKAMLQVEMAVGVSFLGDADEQQAQSRAAMETSRAIDHPLMIVASAGALALAEIALGHFEAAGTLLDQGSAAYERLDDDELAGRTDASFWLSMPEMSLGRFDDAIRHCERGIAVSRAAGHGHWLVALMHTQAFALAALGRLAEATDVAQSAVEIARLGGEPPALATACLERSWVATASGDLAEAVNAGEEALAAARMFSPCVLRAMSGDALARALVEVDQPERARQVLLEAGGGPELALMPTAMKARSYETLTRADLALGRLGDAAGWVDRAEVQAAGEELPLIRAAACRARAVLLLASGHAAEAANVAMCAVDHAMKVGAVLEAGLAQLLAGRALGQAGRRAEAVATLQQAEDVFTSTGAEGYRKHIVAELRRLGRRGSTKARPISEVGSLTAREREIAALVCGGKSNREIARACYLSGKTVETHLSHIFAKLGVSSRAGVATAAADQLTELRP